LLALLQGQQDKINRKGLKLSIEWLPAHTGIRGNEEADRLAKETLSVADKDIITIIPAGISEIMSVARKHYINKWQTDWDETTHTWHYNIKPLVSSKRPLILHQEIETTILKLRLGKSMHLGSSLFKKSLPCNCGQIEDMNHYLMICPQWDEERAKLKEILKLTNPNMSFNPKNLLNPGKQNQECVYKAIFDFVVNTKKKL
jgi:hypothetical protein